MATRKRAEPKKSGREPVVHYCKACGLVEPPPPRGFEWDAHIVWKISTGRVTTGEMIVTCSPECREALGLKERKVVPESVPDLKGW